MLTASLSFTTFDYFETSCNCILEAQVLTASGRWGWRLGDQEAVLEGNVRVEESEGRVIISSIRRRQHFHILRALLSKTLRRGFTAHQKKAPKVRLTAAHACSPCTDITGHSCCANEGLESHHKKVLKVGKRDLRLTKWQANGRLVGGLQRRHAKSFADGWWVDQNQKGEADQSKLH